MKPAAAHASPGLTAVFYAPQLHELGRGQFGRVWLAHWKGVEVAVKELHRSGDARARAEMLLEAQTLAGLRHPCVVALFGILLDESSVSPLQAHVLECACKFALGTTHSPE